MRQSYGPLGVLGVMGGLAAARGLVGPRPQRAPRREEPHYDGEPAFLGVIARLEAAHAKRRRKLDRRAHLLAIGRMP